MPMDRASVCHFAIAAAAVAFGGCGFKQAGGSVMTSTGGQAGGIGGMGGVGGLAGATGGTGGTGGNTPIIMTLDSGVDGPLSKPDANCGARNKSAMKVAP